MNIFIRHKISSSLMVPYFLWWAFIIYYCFFINRPKEVTCDEGIAGIIYFTPIIGGIYVIGFLAKLVNSKKALWTDYLIFIIIIILPFLMGGLYLKMH
jgi:hypothetical protein